MTRSLGPWGLPCVGFLIVSGSRNREVWGAGAGRVALLWEGFVVSDLFIARFHCIYLF